MFCWKVLCNCSLQWLLSCHRAQSKLGWQQWQADGPLPSTATCTEQAGTDHLLWFHSPLPVIPDSYKGQVLKYLHGCTHKDWLWWGTGPLNYCDKGMRKESATDSHLHRKLKSKSGGCGSDMHNSAKSASCVPQALNLHNKIYPLQRYFL